MGRLRKPPQASSAVSNLTAAQKALKAKEKAEKGEELSNHDHGKIYRERVVNFCIEHMQEHHKLPTATLVAKELGMTIKTASKHLNHIFMDMRSLKLVARSANAKVVEKHLEMILDDKATAPMLGLWYDHFGVAEQEEKDAKKDTGKITVNIVVSQPKNYDANIQEAEIIQDDK